MTAFCNERHHFFTFFGEDYLECPAAGFRDPRHGIGRSLSQRKPFSKDPVRSGVAQELESRRPAPQFQRGSEAGHYGTGARCLPPAFSIGHGLDSDGTTQSGLQGSFNGALIGIRPISAFRAASRFFSRLSLGLKARAADLLEAEHSRMSGSGRGGVVTRCEPIGVHGLATVVFLRMTLLDGI
jgi:hypothetical protein